MTWADKVSRQRPQRPPGVDGGELAVVAHQDQLGPGSVDLALEPVQAATAQERCFIDDDHVLVGECGVPPFQVDEQSGHRDRFDPRAGLELGRGSGGDGGPDHLVAGGLPSDSGGTEHGRLPRPGLADHEVEPVARSEELAHPVGLLGIEMAVCGQDLVDRSPAHLSGGPPDPTNSRVHDPPLDLEHLDSGVAPVPDRGGPTLPAPSRDIWFRVAVTDHPQHVVTVQELPRELGDLARTGIESSGHRRQGVSVGEGGGEEREGCDAS